MMNWLTRRNNYVTSIYLLADFSARTICEMHLIILLTYFTFWHVKHVTNIMKVVEKEAFTLGLSEIDVLFFFGLKDLFP